VRQDIRASTTVLAALSVISAAAVLFALTTYGSSPSPAGHVAVAPPATSSFGPAPLPSLSLPPPPSTDVPTTAGSAPDPSTISAPALAPRAALAPPPTTSAPSPPPPPGLASIVVHDTASPVFTPVAAPVETVPVTVAPTDPVTTDPVTTDPVTTVPVPTVPVTPPLPACPTDGTHYTVGSCVLDLAVVPAWLPDGSDAYVLAGTLEVPGSYAPDVICPPGTIDYTQCTSTTLPGG